MNVEARLPIKYTPEHKDFHRLRYLSKLKDNYSNLDSSFRMTPLHVIDSKLFITPLDIYGNYEIFIH